jgi:hypothetical protein
MFLSEDSTITTESTGEDATDTWLSLNDLYSKLLFYLFLF